MNGSALRSQVDRYLAAVQTHLSDLPAEDREDLVEDLEQHLREVAAEEDGDLEARLGPPDRYAAELRASAGLAPPTRHRKGPGAWLAASSPVRAARRTWERVTTDPRVDEVVESADQARPLWWALRGYVLVLLWGLVSGGAISLLTFPVPRLAASRLFGLLAVAVVVPASYALGRRGVGDPRARWVGMLANVLVVLLALGAFSAIRNAAAVQAWPPQYAYAEPDVEEGALLGPQGQRITNIFPYGPDGEPLKGVLLYDQNGEPVSIVAGRTDDGVPIVTSYPLTPDGRPVTNSFPQHQAARDDAYEGPHGEGSPGDRPSIDVPLLRGEETGTDDDETQARSGPAAGPTPSPASTGATREPEPSTTASPIPRPSPSG